MIPVYGKPVTPQERFVWRIEQGETFGSREVEPHRATYLAEYQCAFIKDVPHVVGEEVFLAEIDAYQHLLDIAGKNREHAQRQVNRYRAEVLRLIEQARR